MRKVLTILFAFAIFVSCSKEGDTIYKPDPAEKQASTAPIVIVVHNVGGVGDLSYNDLIFQGVERSALKHGLRTLQLVPKTQQEAQTILESVFQQVTTATDSVRRLLIVSSSYDDFVRKNNKRLENCPRADLLLLDTPQQLEGKGSTLYMPYYGAMYKAGYIAPLFMMNITLIGANPKDHSVVKAIEGFTEGYKASGGEDVVGFNTIYLSDQAGSGYSLDDETALMLLSENEIYSYLGNLIVPICGGGMSTIARLSNLTDSYSFVGVDVSGQYVHSDFSVVKQIGLAVSDCIEQWLSAEGMPKHQSLGLESEYTDVLLHAQSERSREIMKEHLTDEFMAEIHQQAVRKEAENDQ